MATATIDVGILTVSDRCSRGEQVDESGANLSEIISSNSKIHGNVVIKEIVPDDIQSIQRVLKSWCDEQKLALILTTGGTGLSPRDVTPEATKKIIEKEAMGISMAMLKGSLDVTPFAMLSRSVCGVRGATLIINLPGSKKASQECLLFILPVLPHAVNLIQNDQDKIVSTHKQVQGHHDCSHSNINPGNYDENQKILVNTEGVARRHRTSPFPAISVSTAQAIVLKEAPILQGKIINYKDGLGKILAQSIYAKDPVPPFPASIKDGYAVIASDGPGLRKVIGESYAGFQGKPLELTPGNCMRINTGAPIPNGADAVVQVEDTELTKEEDDGKTEIEINILSMPKVGQDIRAIGSDIERGQLILNDFTKLGPSELGLLAMIGATDISVYNWPKVAVLSSGNELVEPSQPLSPGLIRDCNKTSLLMLLQENGFTAIDVGIAKDDRESVCQKIKEGLDAADVLITTGGVSMGDKDYMKQVLQMDFRAKIHFGRVFMKPGLPTTFATISPLDETSKKLIFGLPGNPVSATVTFYLYVLPALRKMMGCTKQLPTMIKAKIMTEIRLDPRPEFHRGFLQWLPDNPIPVVESTGSQMSSRLMSMKTANALMVLPPCSQNLCQMKMGEIIDVIVIGDF